MATLPNHNGETEKDAKKVTVPRSAAEIQGFKLQKLFKNPDKPVFIPEKPEPKLPRVFNPPEFVRNIWGSSAGAGSGDFHVYRGIRRREYARQKFMNIKAKKDELDEEFQNRLLKHKKAAIERTEKKRTKRLKKKQVRKAKQQKCNKMNNTEQVESSDEDMNDDSPDDSATTTGTTATTTGTGTGTAAGTADAQTASSTENSCNGDKVSFIVKDKLDS